MEEVSKPGRSFLKLFAALGLLLTVLTAPLASAQTPVNDTSSNVLRTITVIGTGTVSITPDTADVTFAVNADAPVLKDAQDDSSARIQAVTDSLLAGGVAEADIVTSGYYIYTIYEYDNNGNTVGVLSYRVEAQITATVRDLDALGTLMDSVVTAGANGIWGLSFYVDDPSAAESEARTLAIQDARTKADEYAAAAGATIIAVVSINESPYSVDSYQPYYAEYAGYGGADMSTQRAGNVPVSPGSTEIVIEVQVVFELDQANG